MPEDTTTQCLLFPDIFSKKVVACFDQHHGSSDGGAILLKAVNRRYGLIGALASCLQDERQAGKIEHTLRGKAPGHAMLHRLGEKLLGYLGLKQSIPVLAEHCRVPYMPAGTMPAQSHQADRQDRMISARSNRRLACLIHGK